MRRLRFTAAVLAIGVGFSLSATPTKAAGLGIGQAVSELATQGIYGPQLVEQIRELQEQNGIGRFNKNRVRPFEKPRNPFSKRIQDRFGGKGRGRFQKGRGLGRGRGRARGRGRSFGRGRGRR